MMENNKKIWLSHSGIEILNRCPRCFWLRYNKNIYQPEGIVSRLPGRFDIVIKKYFNRFRTEEILPPVIKDKINGKLEKSFQEKYFYSINDRYGFWGKLDECIINTKNEYSPLDFKTTSSDPKGRLSFPSYQNQLDEFSFLLEVNNKKTAGVGYLVYFYPEEGSELHNGFPMVIYIETLKTNPDSVLPRLLKIIGILEDKMPNPAQDCPFCNWYEKLNTILKTH